MTITGVNLEGGYVTFGGVPATDVSCTATVCHPTAPPNDGTNWVIVTTTQGSSGTANPHAQFTYTSG